MDNQTEITVREMARVLDVSETAVYKWLVAGRVQRPLTIATIRGVLNGWRHPIEAAEKRLQLLIEEMETTQ